MTTYAKTLRRRAVQPLWTALDKSVRPALEGGVLLCVSGGTDSSALLEATARWRHRLRGRMEVASVDHGHRETAPDEVEAVHARALALGFEAHTLRATPARKDEGTLREGRYRTLWSCARDRGLAALCTAHHADDDAEGLLMDLLGLGGGREGAGLAPVLTTAQGLVLRPFVDVTRRDLQHALSALGAPAPFVDPDDARGQNARARLRAQVWPVLSSVQPRAKERVAVKARRRAEDESALGELARAALVVDGEDRLVPLEGLSLAVARRAVQQALRDLNVDVDPRRAGRTVDKLLSAAGLTAGAKRGSVGASFDLPGCVAVIEKGALRIKRRDRTSGPASDDPSP